MIPWPRMEPPARVWRLLAVTVTVAVIAWLGGCGGGVGTGGTGTYASGAIAGFGSIVVNDVRFDDAAAVVEDDDGTPRARADLRLGMTVEIEAGAIDDRGATPTAVASRIRVGHAIVGPVSGVDLAGRRLTVLGQTVAIGVDTVFDDRLPAGLASVRPGEVLEVHGYADPARRVLAATRIEPRALAPAWQLRGTLDALDPAARTLRIGDATFGYAGAASVPAGLAVGRTVLLRLATATDAAGRFLVTGFGVPVLALPEGDDARLRGRVTAFRSATAFDVNGQPVDASAAAFPDGSAGLAAGARVDVRGAVRGGVLVAERVRVVSDDEVRERGVDLEGTIESVDAAARTFRLRRLTISYARPDLRLEDGTLADLVPGRRVEVRAQLAADQIRLEATRIKFE